MNRDEFCSLPASVALGYIWDHGIGKRLEGVEAPRAPLPPKFDSKIFRKGGYQWASETDLESLQYWHTRYSDSAAGGGDYAEKDAKRAKALGYWIAWRLAYPTQAWSGERDRQRCTAAPPSRNPPLHDRDAPDPVVSEPMFEGDGHDVEGVPF